MRNILFIHPSRRVLGKKDNLFTNESLVPSLGLASISAYCRKYGIKSKVIDLRLPHCTSKDVLDYISDNKPLLVGITAFTTEVTAGNEIARLIKEFFPQLPIVVGGPHPSIIPRETLSEFTNFDIAVIGEGEKTLIDLIQIFENKEMNRIDYIRGIAFRRQGEIIVNPPPEPMEDINSLPFPAWDYFELEYYHRIFPVSTSRGCPYSCYFCSPKYLGDRVRVRNYQNIVEEIKWLVDRFGAKRLQFADATLGLLKEGAIMMCEEIIRKGLNKKIKWDCETRADSVNLELLRRMKEAGCEWIAFGVETGSERILKEVVKKGETKEEIRHAVRLAKKVGLKVRCFFIIGHYTETVDTIKETIDFALELNPDALSFGLMVPNPGSQIRKLAEEGKNGLRILHNRWEDYQQFNYDCFELENLPLRELKRWQAQAYFTFYLHHPIKGLELFFNRSSYNYRLSGLITLPWRLLRNRYLEHINIKA
ncbi:MAG: radical SAM protein [Candidatus Omnitrophota bacterium]